ncbi:MAG: hypothetical protein KC466_15890 [Myxococcales bacterium]|nr:hypothetical protein [Myxococcales bacterium]
MREPKLKNLLQTLENLDYQFVNETEALNARLVEFEERLNSLRLPVSASVNLPVLQTERDRIAVRRMTYDEYDGAHGLWIVVERPGDPQWEWTPLVQAPNWVRRVAPRVFMSIVEQMVTQAQKMVSGVSQALSEAEKVLDEFSDSL